MDDGQPANVNRNQRQQRKFFYYIFVCIVCVLFLIAIIGITHKSGYIYTRQELSKQVRHKDNDLKRLLNSSRNTSGNSAMNITNSSLNSNLLRKSDLNETFHNDGEYRKNLNISLMLSTTPFNMFGLSNYSTVYNNSSNNSNNNNDKNNKSTHWLALNRTISQNISALWTTSRMIATTWTSPVTTLTTTSHTQTNTQVATTITTTLSTTIVQTLRRREIIVVPGKFNFTEAYKQCTAINATFLVFNNSVEEETFLEMIGHELPTSNCSEAFIGLRRIQNRLWLNPRSPAEAGFGGAGYGDAWGKDHYDDAREECMELVNENRILQLNNIGCTSRWNCILCGKPSCKKFTRKCMSIAISKKPVSQNSGRGLCKKKKMSVVFLTTLNEVKQVENLIQDPMYWHMCEKILLEGRLDLFGNYEDIFMHPISFQLRRLVLSETQKITSHCLVYYNETESWQTKACTEIACALCHIK